MSNLEINLFEDKPMELSKEILKSYVPYEIQESYIFNQIFNAYGKKFDKLRLDLKELLLQILPQTATEIGIERWEKRVGIVTNTSKALMERRARVLAKFINRGSNNAQVIKRICEIYFGEVEVVEHNSKYYFELNLLTKNGFTKELDSLYEVIETIKPAHLNVNYNMKTKLQSDFFVASGNLIGEKIKVYPWMPQKIEAKSKVCIPINNYIQLEKVTVYPRKEES